MNKITAFMDELEKKKDGSTMTRNGFEVKKLNRSTYELNFKSKNYKGESVMTNYIRSDKNVIKTKLYEAEKGVLAWRDDGVPIIITQNVPLSITASKKLPFIAEKFM